MLRELVETTCPAAAGGTKQLSLGPHVCIGPSINHVPVRIRPLQERYTISHAIERGEGAEATLGPSISLPWSLRSMHISGKPSAQGKLTELLVREMIS